MENKLNNSEKSILIPVGLDLNNFNKKTVGPRLDVFINGKDGLTHKEIEKIIFNEIIKLVQKLDFNSFVNTETNVEIRDKIEEVLTSDIKIIDSANLLTDDEKFVLIMEYLKYLTEENNLGLIQNHGKYYLYNQGYWQVATKVRLVKFLSAVAEKTGIPSLKARQHKVQEKLQQQFDATLALLEDTGNENDVRINLLNGTFYFNSEGSEGSGLRNAKREDFFKYQLPFNYDPTAKAPLFEKFLDRVLPDKNTQEVLMEYIGYIFTSLKLEKVAVLYGSGANGKSVFFEIIKALLGGENLSYYSMDKLVEPKGQYRANLDTKLLNYASEFGNLKDIETFKKMVSGEPIDARSLYQDPVELTKYCRFMFNANTLPKVEQTEAFFRRYLIIPFNQTIPEHERDSELHLKIIANELSGVFNIVLLNLNRLIINKRFTKSVLIDNELAQYKRESNSVQLFIEEEMWIKSSTQRTKLGDLLDQYRKYCTESGFLALFRRRFTERLRALGFEVMPGAQNFFYVNCVKKQHEEILSPKDAKDIMGIFNLNQEDAEN